MAKYKIMHRFIDSKTTTKNGQLVVNLRIKKNMFYYLFLLKVYITAFFRIVRNRVIMI